MLSEALESIIAREGCLCQVGPKTEGVFAVCGAAGRRGDGRPVAAAAARAPGAPLARFALSC
jgi:hypothetical protein